jgi:hypothetical protein
VSSLFGASVVFGMPERMIHFSHESTHSFGTVTVTQIHENDEAAPSIRMPRCSFLLASCAEVWSQDSRLIKRCGSRVRMLNSDKKWQLMQVARLPLLPRCPSNLNAI